MLVERKANPGEAMPEADALDGPGLEEWTALCWKVHHCCHVVWSRETRSARAGISKRVPGAQDRIVVLTCALLVNWLGDGDCASTNGCEWVPLPVRATSAYLNCASNAPHWTQNTESEAVLAPKCTSSKGQGLLPRIC